MNTSLIEKCKYDCKLLYVSMISLIIIWIHLIVRDNLERTWNNLFIIATIDQYYKCSLYCIGNNGQELLIVLRYL